MRDSGPRHLLENPTPSVYAIPPHTIKIVAVTKPVAA
jgi:hypothetical protein